MEKKPLQTKNPRLQNLNPMFHFKTPKEDDKILTKSLLMQARKSGVLNLSNKGLSFVPDKVFRIHEADEDELGAIDQQMRDMTKGSSCKNAADEEFWWNRVNLTALDLSSNSLASISGEIKSLVDLLTLNLHDNALTELPEEIAALERLTKANFSHNKLTCLPEPFYRLKDLTTLNLSHNQFVELNADISDLVMLDTLDISHNQLTSLPCGIGFLVRLTTLSASHNKLVELPNDIVYMRSLKKLDLVHNELESLPKEMGQLHKLDCLYVQHNNIRELPDFTGCASLKEIHFSNNFVTEIAGDFCENLPQLQVLDLRDNKIEKLPDEISMLQSLMRLDLSNNSILTLPVSLCTLAHLVSLQLDGNPLRSIRRDIIQSGTTRILKTLRDRSGYVEPKAGAAPFREEGVFPDKFKMRKSHSLAVALKGLSYIDDRVFEEAREAEVTVVDLSKNQFKSLPQGLWQLNSLLRELDVSANQIPQIPSLIGQFDKVVYLNFAKNQLSDLPQEFELLATTLRELNLNNNSFDKIPRCVCELFNLEILLLADNRIAEIDASERGLAKLRRLNTLDLNNNNIEQVPPLLGNMKQIRALELNGNKFRQPRHQILAKGTESIMSYLRDRIPNA